MIRAITPRTIPCRMCQAGPGELCKYKGSEIPLGTALGGHNKRTPSRYRCFHAKRVTDALFVRSGGAARAKWWRNDSVVRTEGACRWRP